MAPARPERSRSTSGQSRGHPDEVEDLQAEAQQAGRSAIHLAAQQSAQSLKESSRLAKRQISSPWSSTPELAQRDSQPSLPYHAITAPSPQPQSRRSPGRRSPLVPSQSSPLNFSSLTPNGRASSRLDGLDGRERAFSEGCQDNRFLTVPSAGRSVSSPQRPKLIIPGPAPYETFQSYSPSTRSQLHSPRSVRELGSDYTRYFNPFATPIHSKDSLPLESSTSSAGDMSRRLSNPFTDAKRLSNPFESPDDSAPLSPYYRSLSPTDDMHPAIATLAVDHIVGLQLGIPSANHAKELFFPYIDDRLGAPEYSFPLITDAKEDDDEMHMPQWDDDIRLKPKFRDHFTRESIVSTCGLMVMLVGLLCIFVVLPVITYTGTSLLDYYYETPLDQMPGHGPPPWTHVNDRIYPLLQHIRRGLIDKDTPEEAKTRISGVTGETLVLVFSDEFNRENRTFYQGDDPFWFGFEGWYGATQDLEWYDPDAINTGGGTLQLQLDQFTNHNLDFRSGMLNSWNQLCFKGGVFEVSMSLPGPAGKHGLWPGVWTMGNLGRPGYLATTDGMWPYTYNECDAGITSNQSMTDGTSNLPGQRLSSCTCKGADHPTPGTGRGAPEIDIAEVSGDWSGVGNGVATQSYQVAPFDIWYYPNYDFMQTPDYSVSFVNSYTGGPYQQAVSTTTMLNNAWYDGKEYQKFAFEYVPGGDENAYISWTVGEAETMRFDARAIGPNGNIGQRLISEEPMSIILNLGISYNWIDVEFQDLKFPTVLQVDYVRWYQRPGRESVTCDPPGFETTGYIARHPEAYMNPNWTRWEDAGYTWPRNEFVHGCGA